MITWLLLIAAILTEVIATLSLKAAIDDPALYVVVVAGYATTFALLVQVLRRGMGLGVAYGIWGACGVTLTAVSAALLFGEELNVLMGLGIALIAAGVLLVEVGSQRARRSREADGSGGEGAPGRREDRDLQGAGAPALEGMEDV